MSLLIDPEDIRSVLLADGWHDVEGNTFHIDSYEYVRNPDDPDRMLILHGGGESGVCAAGFGFMEPGGGSGPGSRWVTGPLTAILAVSSVVHT